MTGNEQEKAVATQGFLFGLSTDSGDNFVVKLGDHVNRVEFFS